MRHVRMKVAGLIGNAWHKPGDIVPIDSDYRAAKLVELGHAEYVAQTAAPIERAIEPENAKSRSQARAEKAVAVTG